MDTTLYPRWRQRPLWMRFVAYSFLAGFLLCIYQMVFLPRTSANRDWNHIHRLRITQDTVQRTLLRDVNETNIASLSERLDILDNRALVDELTQIGWAASIDHSKYSRFASEVKFADSEAISGSVATDLANNNVLGQVSGKLVHVEYGDEWPELSVTKNNVILAKYGHQSPSTLIERAHSGAAVAIILYGDNEPLFGRFDALIPTVLLNGETGKNLMARAGNQVCVNVQLQSTVSTVQATIYGTLPSETVIIGDDRYSEEDTAALLEVMTILGRLSSQGWIPYRTIRVIFYGSLMMEDWAHKHSSMLSSHSLAYISANRVTRASTSPLLKAVGDFAAINLPTPRKIDWKLPHLPYGAGSILYRYGVPIMSVSPELEAVDLARFLGLAISHLLDHNAIPFHTTDYANFLLQFSGTEWFYAKTCDFDGHVDRMQYQYTTEYPWFDGIYKLRSIVGLKLANLRLMLWERKFLIDDRHAIYGVDEARNIVTVVPLGHKHLVAALEAATTALI